MIAGNAAGSGSIQQYLRTQNIGFKKHAWVQYRTVHMAFRRKIDHHVKLLMRKQVKNSLSVCYIAFDKTKVLILQRTLECPHISCIGKAVQTDNLIVWVRLQHIINKIAADKAGAACYQNFHFTASSARERRYRP